MMWGHVHAVRVTRVRQHLPTSDSLDGWSRQNQSPYSHSYVSHWRVILVVLGSHLSTVRTNEVTVLSTFLTQLTLKRHLKTVRSLEQSYDGADIQGNLLNVSKFLRWIRMYHFCFITFYSWRCNVPAKRPTSFAMNKSKLVTSLEIVLTLRCTRDGTLIVSTIYLQLIENRYMLRSFTVLQCSHQHCVQPVASDVEVVGYL